MQQYINHQKDVQKLNHIIHSYEHKLDSKINQVISHMLNYSWKINDTTLPEIQQKNNNLTRKTAKSTYRSTYETKSKFVSLADKPNAETLLSSFKQKTEKTMHSTNLEKVHHRGRSMGRNLYQKPKLFRKKPEILPKEMRLNPFCQKNAIKAHELDKGMLSLIERGKIAKNVDIITAFEKGRPILESHPAIFHHMEEKFESPDLDKMKEMDKFVQKEVLHEEKHNWALTIPRFQREEKIKEMKIQMEKKQANKTTEAIEEHKLENIIYLEFLHYKIIQNENYVSVKRKNIQIWNKIREIIQEMQKFLKSANASLVFVDTSKLLQFVHKCKKIKERQLVKCIVKYKGSKLETIMSMKNKIQREQMAKNLLLSFVKKVILRRKYIAILLRRKVENSIGQWLKNGKMIKDYRKKLELHRHKTLSEYAEQQAEFRNNYSSFIEQKHYEIHIMNKPFMQGFKYEQIYNTEITRIFNLSNQNTHIIYICPFQLSPQTMNYYFKIMQLEEIQSFKERVLFMEVDPDHRLPFNLTTSAKLFYNSRALRKLQRRIKGVPSYIVTSYPSEIDIKLSVFLKIPIFSGNLHQIKTMKKCIESQFGVQTLPSLKIEPKQNNILSLSNKIMNFCEGNKKHNKFIIKLSSRYESSGLALLQYPFSSLPQMYSNTALIQPFYFRTIDRFFSQLIKEGGIIQRFEEGVQAITVSVKILNNGSYTIEGTFDKISSGFVNVGYIFPQKSISHKVLMDKSKAVIERLISVGHIGNAEITFFKDIHERLYLENVQLYWTKIGHSLTYFKFLTGGSFNQMGEFMTKISNEEEEQSQFQMLESRGYCFFPFVLHFGLSEKQIASFFQLCRIAGISFDLENKYGSTFLLLGSMKSSIGIITTAKERKAMIRVMLKTLDFLYKQNSHNISDEMLKQKQGRIKERFNLLALKEKLQGMI